MKKNMLALFAMLASLGLVGCNRGPVNDQPTEEIPTGEGSEVLEPVSDVDQPVLPSVDVEGDYSGLESDSTPTETPITITSIDVSALEEGSVNTISEGGSYTLTGTNANARIVVNTTEDVELYLSSLNLTSLTDSPLEVKNAGSIVIHLADRTSRYLSDSSANTLEACLIVKKVPLKIDGEGYLYVTGAGLATEEIDSGVAIQDAKGIEIENARVIVPSSNSHAISAKAGLEVKDAGLELHSKQDGIHSKEGGVSFENCQFSFETEGDGIDAALDVFIKDCQGQIHTEGSFTLYKSSEDTNGSLYEDSKYILSNGEYKKISGDDMGRYSTRYYLTQKCKGVKTEANLTIDGGNYLFDTTDDCIASDVEIDLLSGDFTLSTLDQGINCDQVLNVGAPDSNVGPNISILNSYEGIQGGQASFYQCLVSIDSSDDGMNATSDTLTSVYLSFHEGSEIYVDAEGDGIDSNGNIMMDGGLLCAAGPSSSGNGSLDYDSKFTYTGGVVFALSQKGMIQTPSSTSINVANINLSSYSAGQILTFTTNGTEFATALPKAYSSLNVIVAGAHLVTGNTLTIASASSSSAPFKRGFYVGSEMTQGTSIGTLTLQKGTSTYGSSSQGGGRPGRP